MPSNGPNPVGAKLYNPQLDCSWTMAICHSIAQHKTIEFSKLNLITIFGKGGVIGSIPIGGTIPRIDCALGLLNWRPVDLVCPNLP